MRTRAGGSSDPPYPHRHAGPVLVAGNAWCLRDDLARARTLWPDVPIVAVNGAAREIKAFALFSYHPERFARFGWIGKQRAYFGEGFTVHGVHRVAGCPFVDHWWPDAGGSGGSAWGARKMAGLMGFAPVVLIGCPMVPGPYVGNHNLGGFMHDARVVDDMLAGIAADTDWHDGALSMSGRTMEILGEP